jgi:hypothetical protein
MAVLGSDNLSHSTTFKFNINSVDRVTIDSSGRLLVNATTARTNFFNSTNTFIPFFQLEGTFASAKIASIVSSEPDAAGGGILILGHQRSGTLGGQTSLVPDDEIGRLSFQLHNGTNFVEGADIISYVDGAVTSGSTPGRLLFLTTPSGSTGGIARMMINNAGRVFFDTLTNPTNNATGQLNILATGGDVMNIRHTQNGNNCFNVWQTGTTGFISMAFYKGNAQTIVGSISHTTSSTAFNTSSDYRLKENVVPLTGAIDRLQQIPVHRFNFIVDPGKTVDGFLAHEAQEVVPECVTGTKDEMEDIGNITTIDGDIVQEDVPEPENLSEGQVWTKTGERPVYQGIDQSKIVPLLTAALQEAIAKIEILEAKVEQLEAI